MLYRILLMAFFNHSSECAIISKTDHKNCQLKIHLRTGIIDIFIASLTAGMTSSVKPLQMWCFLPKKYWETEHGLNSLSKQKCGLVNLGFSRRHLAADLRHLRGSIQYEVKVMSQPITTSTW